MIIRQLKLPKRNRTFSIPPRLCRPKPNGAARKAVIACHTSRGLRRMDTTSVGAAFDSRLDRVVFLFVIELEHCEERRSFDADLFG